MSKNILKSLIGGAAVLIASSAAQAYVIDVGGNPITFDSIDWAKTGSAWVTGFTGAGGFDLTVMANATTLDLGGVHTYSFTGAPGAQELTLFATLHETIDSFNGSTANFSVQYGSWNIYQQAVGNSNLKTGVGFTDGTKILGGGFTGGPSGSFSFTGANGFGISAVLGLVNYSNGAVTPTPVGTNAISTLQIGTFNTGGWVVPTGFAALSPAGGTDPLYAPTAGCRNGQCVFQADANQGFSDVPEPASLALVGLGLIGVGALRRRKA